MVENGIKQGGMAALEDSTFRNWVFNSLLAVTTTNNNSSTQAERRV